MTTPDGKPVRWDGAILDWVDERVHELGDFADTNWRHRSVVEVPGPDKDLGWFLHAMTGHEWLLRLVFRVSRNAFKQANLVERLKSVVSGPPASAGCVPRIGSESGATVILPTPQPAAPLTPEEINPGLAPGLANSPRIPRIP